jgi:hypothetical protein
MNTHVIRSVFAGLVILQVVVGRGSADEPRRYQIESAAIEYKLSGTQSGKETLSFDRWGMREAKHTQTELRVAGRAIKSHRLTLLDGEWTWNIDLDKKSGIKMPTPVLPEIQKRLEREKKSLTELGKEMLVHMGGKKVGEEQVLGKPCEVYEIKSLGTKTWIWQGVTLKTRVDFAGQKMLTEAVRIDDATPVPADKFAIPADVKVTEGKHPLDALREARKKMKP